MKNVQRKNSLQKQTKMNKVLILCEIIIKNTNNHTHTHGVDLIAIEMISIELTMIEELR